MSQSCTVYHYDEINVKKRRNDSNVSLLIFVNKCLKKIECKMFTFKGVCFMLQYYCFYNTFWRIRILPPPLMTARPWTVWKLCWEKCPLRVGCSKCTVKWDTLTVQTLDTFPVWFLNKRHDSGSDVLIINCVITSLLLKEQNLVKPFA